MLSVGVVTDEACRRGSEDVVVKVKGRGARGPVESCTADASRRIRVWPDAALPNSLLSLSTPSGSSAARWLSSPSIMAGSRFSYVRNFELPDPLLPGTFMLFRLDGHSFHRSVD